MSDRARRDTVPRELTPDEVFAVDKTSSAAATRTLSVKVPPISTAMRKSRLFLNGFEGKAESF